MRKHSTGCRRGFTLLELLTVIAIMAVMMGATTAAYFGLGRGARLRGAVSTLRTAVGLARQQAILQGQTLELRFSYSVSDGYSYQVINVTADPNHQVGTTGHLPRGILMSSVPSPIAFHPSGSSQVPGTTSFNLTESGGAGTAAMTIYHLTGLMKVEMM